MKTKFKKLFKKVLEKVSAKIPATWKEKCEQLKHDLNFELKNKGWLTLLAEALILPIFLVLVWVLLILLNGMAV